MPIDWAAIAAAGGIGKGQPRVIVKARARSDAEKALRNAYKDVDERDGIYSRVSGRPTTPGAVAPQMRREHHHIKPRSTHPELVTDRRNVFICTAEEHQLIHAGALQVEGTNADKRLVFQWNRVMVAAGKEPFQILSKRKSQRRSED